MKMIQIWAAGGGFFLVYIIITLTNRPNVANKEPIASPPVEISRDTSAIAEDKPLAPVHLADTFLRGIVYAFPGGGASSESRDSANIMEIQATGATWVAINLPLTQQSFDSNDVEANSSITPTPDQVARITKAAHQQRLKVMLRAIVVSADGATRDTYSPSVPTAWLKSYSKALSPYLDTAKSNRIEIVSLGAGFSRLETSAPWPELISDARHGYSGALTYGAAAVPGAGGGGYQTVPFWSQLDYIGIEAFLPLSSAPDPTERELMRGWSLAIRSMQAWTQRHGDGKRLLITAAGVPAQVGGASDPFHIGSGAATDPALQARAAHAFYAALTGKIDVAGAFWYGWVNAQNGSGSNAYDVQNQPALKFISSAYRGE